MQWKRLIPASLFLLASMGLAGCGRTPDSIEPPSPKYGRVRVACPQSVGDAVIKSYGRNWEGQTEGRIEIIPYDPRTGDPANDADVWVIPAVAMPRWAAADHLLPLPESITRAEEYQWKSLLPLYRERQTEWDRKRYAVPLLGESLLCVYRVDWLADPAHHAAFEAKYRRKLAPPATWEQYADIAEYFSRHAQAEKAPSLPPLPPNDDDLEREFYIIAANYSLRAISEGEAVADDRLLFSFQYDSTTGEPRIGTSGFVHALQLMKRMQEYRDPQDSLRPLATFGDGRAVLGLANAQQLAGFQRDANIMDRFAVCRMPGSNGYYDFAQTRQWIAREGNRVPYLGAAGWLGVVPKSTEDEKAAFSLLAHLSGPAVSKQIVIDPVIGGGPTRQDHLDSSTRWDAFGLEPARTAALKECLRQTLEYPGLKNPALCLRTPDETAHRKALQEELRTALRGDKTPEQALRDAAERWAKMDRDKGMAAHRAEYRISLGLLPKD